MNKLISKKDELSKGKRIERIIGKMKNKRDKKGKESEIGKVKNIGMGISKTYNQFSHQ